MEVVGRGGGFPRPAPEDRDAAVGGRLGHGLDLVFGLDRTRPGDDREGVVADSNRTDGDDGPGLSGAVVGLAFHDVPPTGTPGIEKPGASGSGLVSGGVLLRQAITSTRADPVKTK